MSNGKAFPNLQSHWLIKNVHGGAMMTKEDNKIEMDFVQ